MNSETNKFARLTDKMEACGPGDTANLGILSKMVQRQTSLLRPNGEPVPQYWTQFQIGEVVSIKNYSFRVAYIGETAILFEPVGVVDIGRLP